MTKEEYLRAVKRLAEAEGLDLWTALMRVLLVRLREINFPPELQPALAVAERHWAGESGKLVEANGDVWRYINSNWPKGDDVAQPEGRAARALLCVLHPGTEKGEDERAEQPDMTVEWFVDITEGREIGL